MSSLKIVKYQIKGFIWYLTILRTTKRAAEKRRCFAFPCRPSPVCPTTQISTGVSPANHLFHIIQRIHRLILMLQLKEYIDPFHGIIFGRLRHVAESLSLFQVFSLHGADFL